MNRGGFSWKRLSGLSAVKARLSRGAGIPFTRSGRQRKLGAKMGCLTLALVMLGMGTLTLWLIAFLLF